MKTKLFIMAAAAVTLLAACEKDNDATQDANTGRNVNGSGKQVVKMTKIYYAEEYQNYSLQSTSGSADRTEISWSGDNLSHFVKFRFKNGTEVQSGEGSIVYVYNGGVLTEMISNADGEQPHAYLTYTNGLLTEIYTTYDDGYDVGWKKNTISYTDGKVHEITELTSEGKNRSYVLTWNGDNVVRKERYSNGTLLETSDYTYDNKNNPKKIDLAVALVMMENLVSSLSANNVILESEYTTSRSYSYSYSYTYDGDYPVKCVERENNTGSTYDQYIYTTYYEYADGTGRGQVPPIYSINVQSNLEDWYGCGNGEYAAGSTAVIYVAPSWYGHEFRQWSDGNTDNPRSITVNANATYTAIFGNSN